MSVGEQSSSNNDPQPVIIVGGGPIGLISSILLSLRNIPHILFERHPSTSIHPKACGINQRTTEIFRILGIEDEVYAHAAPANIAGRTAWYTGLGGDSKEIISRDAWGGGQYEAEYASFSPSRYCILPQIRLEPILSRRARALNPKGIHYYTEVTSVEDGAEYAVVKVKSRTDGSTAEYRGQYVIVSDGGRSLTDDLGIAWEGERGLFDMVTAHFRADLLKHYPDPNNFITWFSNPEMGGSTLTGYLYQIGPWPAEATSPEKNEFVFAAGKRADDPSTYDEKSMLDRLRATTKLPDLDCEMLSFSHWTVNAIYASKWRVGRLFLLGDAAHRIPPWGALGMNTGAQDVQNLIWKLSLALKHPGVYDDLLDTYQTERLNVGKRVGETSLANMRGHSSSIDGALGVTQSQTPEENVRAAAAYFDPEHPDYAVKREAMKRAAKEMDSEFKAPGLEVGWFYPSVDVKNEGGDTHGGQQTRDGKLVTEFYFPSTIPGHHLPHAWLEQAGKRVAIRDLLPLDQMTLFVAQPWHIGESDKRVRVVEVSPNAWQDVTGAWAKHRHVDDAGGVLVRPDGIVAWRGSSLSSLDEAAWRSVVDGVLHAKRS